MKKSLLMFFMSPLLCLAAIAFVFSGDFFAEAKGEPIISWGVNPNSVQRTPDPPAGAAKLLNENNGIFVGDTAAKDVYLTFDLGYEAGYTNEVLDILRSAGIKAIFFLCGNYLKEEKLINTMIADGHHIGNHTNKHKDLPTLSLNDAKEDIQTFQQSFAQKYPDTQLKFFRPPQGRFNKTVLELAAKDGLKTTLWSIAIVDWGKKPIDAVASADKIAKRLHGGAIILSHITNAGTPKMLRLLLPKIAERGYTIGHPDSLLSTI